MTELMPPRSASGFPVQFRQIKIVSADQNEDSAANLFNRGRISFMRS